jgi:hypothetical protein
VTGVAGNEMPVAREARRFCVLAGRGHRLWRSVLPFPELQRRAPHAILHETVEILLAAVTDVVRDRFDLEIGGLQQAQRLAQSQLQLVFAQREAGDVLAVRCR